MEHFWLYVAMSVVLILTPGADTALVTRSAVVHGKRGAAATALGTTTGVLVHTLLAALGLSAILAQSAVLYEAVKYLGAAYLIYLGMVSLRTAAGKRSQATGERPSKLSHAGSACFRQGLLTNLLNPKVALFFLTFLPQFVQPAGHPLLQLTVMGLTYAVLTLSWLLLYIYLLDLLRGWLSRPVAQRLLEGASGAVLLGFGLSLALERR